MMVNGGNIQSSAMLMEAPSSQASATRPNLGTDFGHYNDGGSMHAAFGTSNLNSNN